MFICIWFLLFICVAQLCASMFHCKYYGGKGMCQSYSCVPAANLTILTKSVKGFPSILASPRSLCHVLPVFNCVTFTVCLWRFTFFYVILEDIFLPLQSFYLQCSSLVGKLDDCTLLPTPAPGERSGGDTALCLYHPVWRHRSVLVSRSEGNKRSGPLAHTFVVSR